MCPRAMATARLTGLQRATAGGGQGQIEFAHKCRGEVKLALILNATLDPRSLWHDGRVFQLDHLYTRRELNQLEK